MKNIKNAVTLVVAIILIGGIWYLIFHGSKKPATDYKASEIKMLSPEDQKKIWEQQEKSFESDIKGLTKGANQTDRDFEITKYRLYIKLAEAQNGLGRYEDALKSLNNIPDSQKSNPSVLDAYAVAYHGSGQRDKALESVKNALLEDNTDVKAWLLNIDFNGDLPNDKLKALYLQAITATKSNVDIMISYAKFSEKAGDNATAIAAWETARNVDQVNADKYNSEIQRLQK